MLSLPPVLRELSSLVRRCLARARQGLLRRVPCLWVFPRGPVKLVGVLAAFTAGEPVVVFTEVCNHEVPLVMSPVIQATGWRIVLTCVMALLDFDLQVFGRATTSTSTTPSSGV